MMIRVLVTGAFGLAAMVVGIDAEVSLSTDRVEACGIKIAVKAAPPTHLRKARAKSADRAPIKRGGSRVAVRKRVDRKGAREPIATGPQRRGKRIERSAEPVANKPAAKPEVTPKAKPKPKQIAKTEPKPEPEVAPTPEPEPEPELEPEPEVTPAGAVEVEVFYETGEFALSSDDEAALQEVVEWLKANPKGKLVIEGHTDPVGSTARNKTLSLKRAKAVRAFLTSEAGVPNSRFELRGYGEGNLHYPRNSPKNRRIVVRSR